jgi:hypothetical protein
VASREGPEAVSPARQGRPARGANLGGANLMQSRCSSRHLVARAAEMGTALPYPHGSSLALRRGRGGLGGARLEDGGVSFVTGDDAVKLL